MKDRFSSCKLSANWMTSVRRFTFRVRDDLILQLKCSNTSRGREPRESPFSRKHRPCICLKSKRLKKRLLSFLLSTREAMLFCEYTWGQKKTKGISPLPHIFRLRLCLPFMKKGKTLSRKYYHPFFPSAPRTSVNFFSSLRNTLGNRCAKNTVYTSLVLRYSAIIPLVCNTMYNLASQFSTFSLIILQLNKGEHIGWLSS